MATYALQFLTRDGSICGQHVLNYSRALYTLQSWTVNSDQFAVSILIVGASFPERTALGDLAVADVFFNRRDALQFVNKLQEKQT